MTFPSHVKKESGISYSTFRGVITKHHLVQIAPVAISAAFCVSESDSAGLARSLMPARTMHHYRQIINSHSCVRKRGNLRQTFITGALRFVQLHFKGTQSFHHSPEMNRLNANRAVPQSRAQTLRWCRCCCRRISGLISAPNCSLP